MKSRVVWIVVACLALAVIVAVRCASSRSPSTTDSRASGAQSAPPKAFEVVTSPMPQLPNLMGAQDHDASAARAMVQAPWGSAKGSLGRIRPSEGNPEGPMSFALAPGGAMVAIDQVNKRLSVFGKDGRFERDIATPLRGAQDVAVGPDGKLAVLDRLVDKEVAVVDRDGKTIGHLPLEGAGIPKGGGVTGVFVDGKDVYAEVEHGRLVLLGNTDGTVAKDRTDLPGRPSRDGRLIISAGIVQATEGRMWVSAMERATMTHRFTRELRMPMPILRIVLLDSDKAGTIYVAAHLGDESLDHSSGVQLVCLDPERGVPTGRTFISVPDDPEEMFRTMAVADEGGVVIAVPTDNGMEYRVYGCT